MKLNRSAGWLLLTFTPLLMAVRSQHTKVTDSPSIERAATPLPSSITNHQAKLDNSISVLLNAVEEKATLRSASLYGSGNITQPMACIVKE